MSGNDPQDRVPEDVHNDDEMLDADEADEVVPEGDDVAMDSDEGDDEPVEEIALQNDSVAHFDGHKDSIFCIAQHPLTPFIVATGGGDDTAYIFGSTPAPRPVLPASYESNPQPVERASLQPLATLQNHTDSVNTLSFTLPSGSHLITAGLDGRLNIYATPTSVLSTPPIPVATAQEVEEINWLTPCPSPSHPETFALGASDGSVWVYGLSTSNTLEIVQAYYLHTAPCTAGTWTPDGKLLCTVSEDGSLYVWDVWGDASAAGLTDSSATGGGQAVVGLTAADERFRVDGGLYSVAVSPGGAIVAVGGAEGQIRVVGLPRFGAGPSIGKAGAGSKAKAGGAKQAAASTGQGGAILASLGTQSDGVETLAFSQPPLTLLAAGSVDGSIAMFDVAHNFAVRRHIKDAHEEEAVIKVEFVREGRTHLLTSVGNDGVVRRWDVRGGTAAAAQGFVQEWRGHRGGGEGGGILGFVQANDGSRIVTAGDDGVSLVFDAA